MITSTKFYVPVVTLSINRNIKFLENLKQGFKKTISWNKYRAEITKQPKNRILDYIIDPTFRNINDLFVQLFKVGRDDHMKNCFNTYYLPYVLLVEMKDFNVLIDINPFVDQSIKKQARSV